MIASVAASPVAAQCVGSRFNIVEERRIRVERRVAPGSTCFHDFSDRRFALASVTIGQRPKQGRIEPSATGRGAYEYRSNANASGQDSYVIRAEFNRMNAQTGTSSGKTWMEVEFVVTFGR
ncbi:MAG: hypothetical protein ACRCTI_04795 [Beijerinckiaceae bacterium]